MTEFVLLAAILVPLMFGTAMLGKNIDLSQRAVMASRFAVWETTVHDHGADGEAVRARFFEPGQATGEGGGAASSGAAGEPLAARDPVVQPTRVDVRVAGVATRFEASEESGVARKVGKAVDVAGDTLGRLSGGEWDITANGLTRGDVDLSLAANGWLGATTIRERSVVMNDGWSASGLAQVNDRTRSFVPAGMLRGVGNLLSHVSVVPVFKELKGLDGAFGKVDASSLPLPEVRTLQPYAERSR